MKIWNRFEIFTGFEPIKPLAHFSMDKIQKLQKISKKLPLSAKMTT